MDIKELLSKEDLDHSKAIDELKSKRNTTNPETSTFKKELDPLQHDVYDTIKRPNKKVKIDPDDPDYHTNERNVMNVTGGETPTGWRYEPVARVALAIQKLIVNRAVSFVFGNAVTLDSSAEGDGQKSVLKALKRVMYDIKEKSFNRKVARNLFSCTEVAEYWYPVEVNNSVYGFSSKFKLRSAIFSPLLGDALYPYFDETGDMVAFSREFSVTTNNKAKVYFETYTDEKHYMWEVGTAGHELSEGYPKDLSLGRIPIVFGCQPQVEWADVQNLIDRLEKLLSNFADTNDYHASPKIFIEGELKGFAKKGESGAILQGAAGTKASYLSWNNAPEAVKLEINTLLQMIYTITQTPDISFDAVKGLGSISGVALKLLFMDAHLKVADHQEVFDEYLQRRINIIKAFIGKFNTKLATEADNLMVEPIITPYMIIDELAEIKIWTEANGGGAVISNKGAFNKANLTNDTEADFIQYEAEQKAKNMFSLSEPTM